MDQGMWVPRPFTGSRVTELGPKIEIDKSLLQRCCQLVSLALLKVLGPPIRGGKTPNLAGRLTIWRLDRSKIDEGR